MAKISIEELIAQLDTPGDRKAEAVIAKLAKLPRSKVVPRLMEAARDLDQPRIRKWSLQALGGIADAQAAPLLIKALKEDRMTVRLHALSGLRRMRLTKGLPQIAKLLKDESGGIRINALATIRDLKGRRYLPQVRKLLKDPQWYVRQETCRVLEDLKDPAAKPVLKKLASQDPKKAVRTAAEKALRSFETNRK